MALTVGDMVFGLMGEPVGIVVDVDGHWFRAKRAGLITVEGPMFAAPADAGKVRVVGRLGRLVRVLMGGER